jgi:hypothetical protein
MTVIYMIYIYDMEYQGDGDIYDMIHMIWSTNIHTHTNVYVVQYHKGKEVQRVHALSRAHMREV